MEGEKQTIAFNFLGKIRKSTVKKKGDKEYVSYLVTIPKEYVEVYKLERILGKTVKITMNIEEE